MAGQTRLTYGNLTEREDHNFYDVLHQMRSQNQFGNSGVQLSFADHAVAGQSEHSVAPYSQQSDEFSIGMQEDGEQEISYGVELFAGRDLQEGDTGLDIRALQDMLILQGYMTTFEKVSSTHTFGNRTKTAVIAFQEAHHLTGSGVVDAAMRTELRTALSAGEETLELTGEPPLEKGARGDLVEVLQERLVFFGADIRPDGDFGNRTKQAIETFQERNGLPVTGICDAVTAIALNNDSSQRIVEATQTTDVTAAESEVDALPGDPRGYLSDPKMHPKVREITETLIEIMHQQGYQPYVICGFRTFDEQRALYNQGRSTSGSIVTNANAGESWHNYGLAVDICFYTDNGRSPTWDKPSEYWEALGRAGLAAGFTRWLGRSGDRPHFEYHPAWTRSAGALASTYYNSGLDAVWDMAVGGQEEEEVDVAAAGSETGSETSELPDGVTIL